MHSVLPVSARCIVLLPSDTILCDIRFNGVGDGDMSAHMFLLQFFWCHSLVIYYTPKIRSHLHRIYSIRLYFLLSGVTFYPHDAFSSSICLVIYQSIFFIMLPNHPFTIPFVCQATLWYPSLYVLSPLSIRAPSQPCSSLGAVQVSCLCAVHPTRFCDFTDLVAVSSFLNELD